MDKNHENYYDTICKDLFKEHGEKIDALMIVVQNGLSHRIKRIDRIMWLVATVVIGKIVMDIFF